jgi:hypothetical protein
MEWSEALGWAGAVLVLFAYYFTLVKNWEPESGRYMLISCLAAVLLAINAGMKEAYPFVITNAAMLVVTAYSLLKKGPPGWK